MGCEEHVGNSLLPALTWRMGCERREAGGFLGAGRSRETELPRSPPKELGSAGIGFSQARPVWTCNLQNCKIMHQLFYAPKQNKIKLKYTFAELYPQSV